MNTVCKNFSMNESDQVNITSMCLNDTFNQSDSQLSEVNLFDILGPKRSPLALHITVVYLLIFILGLSGNILTCVVIGIQKKMHNPTNFYLVSLAASDLLVLLFGMPWEIYELWENYPFLFGEGGCFFKTFLFETICFASILNVTALSVERYIAVVHPLKTRYLSTNQHARRVIATVWVVSMTCAVPNTSLHGIFYLTDMMKESATCTVVKPLWIYNTVMQITTVCFYVVPMAIISVLFVVMSHHLNREKYQDNGILGKDNRRRNGGPENGRVRQVIKMLTIVAAVFGLCWAPFHTERLLWSSITQWTDQMHNIYQYVHIISGVLFYLSSAINPIIYSLVSTRFRESFRELMCAHPGAMTSIKTDSSLFTKTLRDTSMSTSRPQAEFNGKKTFILRRSPTTTLTMDTAFKETTLCSDTVTDGEIQD